MGDPSTGDEIGVCSVYTPDEKYSMSCPQSTRHLELQLNLNQRNEL